MIVVDASVVLEALLTTPLTEVVEERLFASGDSLHGPCLLDIEAAHVLRAYDATYVALAEALDGVLVTRDQRLANAPGIRAAVEVFGDVRGFHEV